MPRRMDRAGWTPEQDAFLRECYGRGLPTRAVHAQWPSSFPPRSAAAIGLRKGVLGIKTAPNPLLAQQGVMQPPPPVPLQTVDVQDEGDTMTLRSFGSEVTTIDQLIARCKADLTVWELDRPETSMHEQAIRYPDGEIRKVQQFRLVAKLRRKQGPTTKEQVDAILAGAFAQRKPLPSVIVRGGNADILQGVVIPDAHIGDLAWGEGTGGPNNDTAIGVDTLRRGVTDVMAQGDERRVGLRHFWLLGDYFHHDGKGMTTKGTPLDYDSRIQKMLKLGSEVLFDLIEGSASKVPTRVILVPGNHDAVLTWALQRILVSEFRRHKGVTIDDSSTTTKWLTHGKCLLGLDHGDKGKKRLPEVMAAQCAVEWGQTTCRHIHTGHLHGKAKIVTEGGVVVWTHDSLKPADQWHTDEKFNTSPRTIEAYRYHAGGMFAGSDAWSPDLNAAPRSGIARRGAA